MRFGAPNASNYFQVWLVRVLKRSLCGRSRIPLLFPILPIPFRRLGGGGEGGEGPNKCLYGEAPPQGPIPHPFINHFSRKTKVPLWYT